jgi:hypothetical protein
MVYSGERVYRILRNREEMFDIRIGNRTLKEYTEDEIKRIWEAIPNADYDITVSEAKYSKTKRDRDIEMLATLASQGVAGIDGRSLLELWDLPPNIKEQLLSYANQNAQMAQEIESQKLQVAEKQQMIAAQSKVQVKAAELAQKDALERDKLAQKDKVDTANIDLKLIEINAKAATDLGKIKNSSN